MSQTNTLPLSNVSLSERSPDLCIFWLLFLLHVDADLSEERAGLMESKET